MVKRDEAVHVQIGNSLYLRKLILQTAINAAELVKDYHSIVKIGKEKKLQLHYLERAFEEIRSKEKFLARSEFPVVPSDPKVKKVFETSVEEGVEHDSALDKLRLELAEIESKLKRL